MDAADVKLGTEGHRQVFVTLAVPATRPPLARPWRFRQLRLYAATIRNLDSLDKRLMPRYAGLS